ncbi:PIN domain-containing protein [Bacillaceae bacterium C204]|uniref:PIN domain-containing protein n=1 Tax=Neobacillus sp. 204 TaxID=3383351 RepID=UPI00397B26AB
MNADNAIAVDTNVLLYLFQPDKHTNEVFNRFISNILFLQADLIITNQILEEWERHKESNYNKFLDQISESINRHEDLIKYVEEKARQNLKYTLEKIKKMEVRKYKYTYGQRAKKIDKLLKDPRTIILDRTPDVDKHVVDFAISKKPPFFGGEEKNGVPKVKNEAADASIFFTLYSFLKKSAVEYNNVYFITENKKDFSRPDNPAELHDNLKPFADEVGLKFSNNLNRALLEINPKDYLVKDLFSGIEDEFLSDRYFTNCSVCGGEVHINAEAEINYSLPPHRQTYILKCQQCGHSWDTGDLVNDF